MNGIINVYKEKGFTSHDVVAKLRGILHMKKIGHTGTLDPEAEGVLPVCLGKATGLCGMITDKNKTYEAVMLLGTTTDTQDTTGKVLETKPVEVSEVQIIDTCNTFQGEYYQTPPMYSALKHKGHKLYELARQGIEIERAARKVYIKSLHINEINLTDEEKTVTLTVECSKGTYIRTLCDDIGKKLGCGACMKHLVRTRVERFAMNDSLTLKQIEDLVAQHALESHIVPIDTMFEQLPALEAKEEFGKLLYNGNKLEISMVQLPVKDAAETTAEERLFVPDVSQEEQRYRVYDTVEHFIGIYEIKQELLVPVKIFFAGEQ